MRIAWRGGGEWGRVGGRSVGRQAGRQAGSRAFLSKQHCINLKKIALAPIVFKLLLG